MRTIAFLNQKGGCGKSSSCFHLSGAFAQNGWRVLLVDADPQGSLSQGFLGSELVENLPSTATVAAAFDGDELLVAPESLVRPTSFSNISIIPANYTLAQFNQPSPERLGLQQFALSSLLDGIQGFDVVLVDCPPNLYLCSWAALLAAEFVVIPVPPEDFGTQGLRVVHEAIGHARLMNPSLNVLGHLVTRSDSRLLVHQVYEQTLRQLFGNTVFDTVIPEAVAFKVALACRQPVGYYTARSSAARLTLQLSREMQHRMKAFTGKSGRVTYGHRA